MNWRLEQDSKLDFLTEVVIDIWLNSKRRFYDREEKRKKGKRQDRGLEG